MKACTRYFPVLLRTTKLAQSSSQYFFVLQSLHEVFPSTSLYYNACTKYFPVLQLARFQAPKPHLHTAVPLRSASLACKSHYNCVDHPGNQQDPMDAANSLYKLRPKITKPSGTTQSIMSSIGLKVSFTMEEAMRTQKNHLRAPAAPSSHRRGCHPRCQEPLCARKQRVSCNS